MRRKSARRIAAGGLAAVMHIEGAEGIDADFQALDVLYAAGLRSIGPVWSRPNIFGHGVPFRFPSSPDTGPGLTDLGKELVRCCNARRIIIDLSHMNEQGFWDVARDHRGTAGGQPLQRARPEREHAQPDAQAAGRDPRASWRGRASTTPPASCAPTAR